MRYPLKTLAAATLVGVASLYAGGASGDDGWITLLDSTNKGDWSEVGKANWEFKDGAMVADKLESTQLVQAFAESQNGNSGYYVVVAGTALNNWKLKCFLGGGTEISAGAYPASVTGDVVQLSFTSRKLL